jgi:hypothetical protein
VLALLHGDFGDFYGLKSRHNCLDRGPHYLFTWLCVQSQSSSRSD